MGVGVFHGSVTVADTVDSSRNQLQSLTQRLLPILFFFVSLFFPHLVPRPACLRSSLRALSLSLSRRQLGEDKLARATTTDERPAKRKATICLALPYNPIFLLIVSRLLPFLLFPSFCSPDSEWPREERLPGAITAARRREIKKRKICLPLFPGGTGGRGRGRKSQEGNKHMWTQNTQNTSALFAFVANRFSLPAKKLGGSRGSLI